MRCLLLAPFAETDMRDHGEYWAIGGSRADIVCIDQVGTPLTRAPAAEYYGVIVMPIEQSRDSKQFSAFELSGWDANIGCPYRKSNPAGG